ncbi:peptidase family C50-domain-containing protein [Syncephalis pseudoplumigaleata]|uniref:separase n=1 Tax=Syncephalis pseudoplumigaleata TaxID=1712513 RepID=A0A4P9Z2F5_9FUNG|nr:peptidase family C50-domain-containing protein [Syncephalis pseudoplumigaleata]|eukprot:RKP25961.1 peptidase family C50-domain-containing protein [Syncephalis pseudoplumigaleata]
MLLYAGSGGGTAKQAATPEEADEADQQLTNDVEDVLYYLLDAFMYQGVPVPFDEIEFDKVCVQAIVQHYQSMRASASAPPSHHTVLILDKSTHMFPWESMPVLRGRSVARLPTWTIWRDNIMARREGTAGDTVDAQRTQYLLNPAGDLSHTEAQFAPLMKQRKWKGITGRIPMEQELWTSLTTSDVFLYFGHGGAEQYIKGSTIRKLDGCAVSLLMGCSSGYLAPEGEFEPAGTPWHYLVAGSRAVVVNLWDVTDKDIDRFGVALLKRWGLLAANGSSSGSTRSKSQSARHASSSVHEDLGTAVAMARDECTLRYLVGAAPVVYGMPHMTVVPS